MDQESFRRLLQTPRPGGSAALGAATGPRGFKLGVPGKKKTSVEASEPAFKPRTVKKSQDSKYRDRAAERRVGDGNDYAHIEAVLEDFEKKNAEEDREKVEAQRKYLGGDSEHSILVKGLDFALLEQNKARSVLTSEDVDALDQVFLESSEHRQATIPKKRTREDLLRELKEQRESGKVSTSTPTETLEDGSLSAQNKLKGKFKPIGQADVKKNSKSNIPEGERKKKKKRKVDGDANGKGKGSIIDKMDSQSSNTMPPPTLPAQASAAPVNATEQEPADDDFDIFAGAGEYEGVDIGEDEEDEVKGSKPTSGHDLEEGEEPSPSTSSAPKSWIFSDEPGVSKPNTLLPAPVSKFTTSRSPPSHQANVASDNEDMEDILPMRLVPLSSSALPSIKEFLAMDKAAGSYDKKKKRKDKKKTEGDEGEGNDASKKKTLEAKVDRDYQRLKSYTEKKAAAGSK